MIQFDPIRFGYSKTEDPWIFTAKDEKIPNATIMIEKTTVGTFIISRNFVEDEFPFKEILFHGEINSTYFAACLLDNIGASAMNYKHIRN